MIHKTFYRRDRMIQQLLEYAVPQPANEMIRQLYLLGISDDKRTKGVEVSKVCAMALLRIGIAGALYYGIHKVGADAKITSGVVALFGSTPAAALYWGAKWAVDGGKMIYKNFPTRDYQQMAIGGGMYLGGVTLMNMHNYALPIIKRFGLLDAIASKYLETDKISLYNNVRGY